MKTALKNKTLFPRFEFQLKEFTFQVSPNIVRRLLQIRKKKKEKKKEEKKKERKEGQNHGCEHVYFHGNFPKQTLPAMPCYHPQNNYTFTIKIVFFVLFFFFLFFSFFSFSPGTEAPCTDWKCSSSATRLLGYLHIQINQRDYDCLYFCFPLMLLYVHRDRIKAY